MKEKQSKLSLLLTNATRNILQKAADERKWSLGAMIRDVLDKWADQERKDRKASP